MYPAASGKKDSCAPHCRGEWVRRGRTLARWIRRSPTWAHSRQQTPVADRTAYCARVQCGLRSQEIAESAKPQRGIATRRDNLRGLKRLEFFAIAITGRSPRVRAGGGMQIDLAQALRQAADQSAEALFAHLSGPMQSEDLIGHEQPGCAIAAAQKMRERPRQQCRRRPRAFHGSQYALRLDGHASRAQTESSANGGDQGADNRMQME